MADLTYEGALVAAGATVHNFSQFGSYQGDWWAFVTLADGRTGWINGSYGSCSGCDALEAEFDYGVDKCEAHRWEYDDKTKPCAECDRAKAEADAKFAAFGAGYLDGLMSQEDAEKKASEHLEWDSDAPEMVSFIQSRRAKAEEGT